MASKKVEVAELIVKTTDGGSFKIFGTQAKKASKEVDNLGKASQATDRRIKGVTQQSSNATKNFSKQAQTMQGGIVAVYATIAAQVFAVSAAFQFLKSSMETRNLIEGQKAFGSVTGVAYKTLTNDLQAATQGMLDFKTAASSVAIGTASGLSASQMTQLGEAAKNASLALGRDLTDSFNRLVRGVTKAEPELLDELGIVLRLENATRDYALAVGKARDDLNAFERTQAVFNNVIDQATQKFGRITELMDPDAFALGQLTKEIDDLVMGFQTILVKGLLPFIQFFKDNAMALVAAIGLFVAPIIQSLLPDLDKAIAASAKKQDTALKRMAGSYRDMGQEFRTAATGFRKLGEADLNESAAGLDALGVKGKGPGITERDAKTGQFAQTGYKQLNKRQIAAYRRAIKEKKGIYMKFNAEEKAAFKRHLATQEAILNKSEKVKLGIRRRSQKLIDATYNAGVTVFAAAEAAKLQIAKVGAMAMNAVMSIAGVLGVIAMVIAAGKALFDYFAKGNKSAQALKKETEAVHERLKSINEEMGRMKKVRDEGLLGLTDGIEQTRNALQSADIRQFMADYQQELSKSGMSAEKFLESDLGQEFQQQAYYIESLAPGMKGFTADLATGADLQPKWRQLSSDIIDSAMALSRYQENSKAVSKQVEKTIGRMAKLPFQDLMKPLQAGLDDFANGMLAVNARLEEMTENIEIARAVGQNFGKDIVSYQLHSGSPGMGTAHVTKHIDYKKLGTDASELIDSGAIEKEFGEGLLGIKNMIRELSLNDGSGNFDGYWQMNFNQPIQDIVEELILMDNNAELMLRRFGKSEDEIKDMTKELNLARKEAELMRLENDRNGRLMDRMQTIQSSILKLKEDEVAAQQTLANLGVGSGKALAEGKIAFKVKQAEFKKTEAENNKAIAQSNQLLEQDKLRDLLISDITAESEQFAHLKGKELEDAVLAEKKRISEIDDQQTLLDLAGENYKTQQLAVTNSNKAVTNAEAEVELNTTLVENSEAQKILDEAKLNIQFLKLGAIKEELELKGALLNIDNQLKTSDKRGFAAIAEKHAAKGKKITAQQDINKDKQGTNLSSIQQYDPSFTAGMDPLVAMAGLDVNADNYQELVKLYQERVNLQQESAGLTADQTKHQEEAGKFITDQVFAQNQLLHLQKVKGITLNPAEKIFNDQVEAHLKKFGDLTEFNTEEVKKLAIEQAHLNIELELQSGIQDTLSNGFVSMFQAMVDGTKSFKDSMKDLTVSVLQDLAAMFAKAAALKIMMALIPGFGGVMEGISSIPGMGRYGGEMSKFRYGGYTGGGVADGPESGYMAMLHGREAVVPLGNDRSIPVDLRGAGGGGNIVNVTVNMNGQGQGQTQITGDGMQGLGRSIGNMVQQHLQQEMRPGGLLNSQGTKGRG